MTLKTEFSFVLPKGYIDDSGVLHRDGSMRLATARDEIEPLRDPRVQTNEAYLTVIILARVITRMGSLNAVSTKTIEGLFASDLAYLQSLYSAINFGTPEQIAALTGDIPLAKPASTEATEETSEQVNGAQPKRRRGSVEEVVPTEV